MSAFRRLLREPLLHFAAIGAAFFAFYDAVAPREASRERIAVSRALVDELARQFESTWMRRPGDEELAGLVETWVRDEIFYREGVALGLDRDDPVIKRRVRQKLEVIAEEELARDVPTDAELDAYLAQHADRFARPAALSFEQVFFPESAAREELEAARAALLGGADPAGLGRASLLPAKVEGQPLDLVARDFGAEFAGALAELPLGAWSGPLRSGFGEHFVRVTARVPAAVPALDEVRAAVAREWERERRVASLDASYRKLRERYEVAIEAEPSPSVARR